jgi:hypothetical protein
VGDRQRYVRPGGEEGLAAEKLGQDLGREENQGQAAKPAFVRALMAGEVERQRGEKRGVEAREPAVGGDLGMQEDHPQADRESGRPEQGPQPSGREKHGQGEEYQEVPGEMLGAPVGEVAGRKAPRLGEQLRGPQLERGAQGRRQVDRKAETGEKKRGGEPPRA